MFPSRLRSSGPPPSPRYDHININRYDINSREDTHFIKLNYLEFFIQILELFIKCTTLERVLNVMTFILFGATGINASERVDKAMCDFVVAFDSGTTYDTCVHVCIVLHD